MSDTVAIQRFLDQTEKSHKMMADSLEAVKECSLETKAANAQMADVHKQTVQWMKEIRASYARAEEGGYKEGERAGMMIRAFYANDGNIENALKTVADDYNAADVVRAYENAISRAVVQVQNPQNGGMVIPPEFFDEMIPFFRPASRILELGARMIPLGGGQTIIPRLLSGTSGAWLAEGQTTSSTPPTWGKMVMTPKQYMIKYAISNLWLDATAGRGVSQIIAQDAAAALAQEWGRVGIRGDGNGCPYGLLSTLIKSQITNASTASGFVGNRLPWANFKRDFFNANYSQIQNNLAFLINHDIVCAMEGKETSLGTPKWPNFQVTGGNQEYNILGVKAVPDYNIQTAGTTHNPAETILGAWSEFFIGTFRSIEIAYSGHSRFGTNETEMRLIWAGDMGPRQLKAFAYSTDMQTTE